MNNDVFGQIIFTFYLFQSADFVNFLRENV